MLRQTPDISIARKVYDESFLTTTGREESANFKYYCRSAYRKLASYKCTASGFLSVLIGLFPIVRWLPKYNLKKDLLPDITGGVTVGVMHIPQGIILILCLSTHPSRALQPVAIACFRR